jgi:hypothetical protein
MSKPQQTWVGWRKATNAVLGTYFWPSLAGVVVESLERRTDKNGDTKRWREDTREALDEYVEDFLAEIMLNEIEETYEHDLTAAAAG